MKFPLIVTNFKAYESAIGIQALELAKWHAEIAQETGVTMGVAVQSVDVFRVASHVALPVFSQHVDTISYGAYTGSSLPEAVRQAGAFGTLLNHSERRLPHEVLEQAVCRAKEAGLFVIVCVETPEEGSQVLKFGPDLIAVEPFELIGGTVSVSTARPEVIQEAVEKIGVGKVMVGAGIKNAEDVRLALKYGAVGVLLASGITKAQAPELVLRDLALGAS